MTARVAVFTIVSFNYGAFARTLMESLRATHPDWDRFVLVVDKAAAPADIGRELFSTVMVEDLPLPRKKEFLFRYGVMELNTAVKPWMFAHLRGLGYQHVVYLDPDILVLDRLVDIERLLCEGATGVLLPHLTAPIDDGRHPSELDIMRSGSYNLGFLALGDSPAAGPFIEWWKQKLEYDAVSDVERGLFTDQKWMDLAPGLFDGFSILRDPGYDVAYWNLAHRPVARVGNGWTAGGRPLRFFHFSGFNPENPKPFSKHQNRFELDTIGAAKELALEYAGRVLGHDHARLRLNPYGFGSFHEGTPIPEEIRAIYRDNADLRKKAGEDPFAAADVFILGETEGLPTILSGVWLKYRHLQRAFVDPLGASRRGFYSWFIESGATELGIPAPFVEPVRRALVASLAAEGLSLAEATRAIASGSIWTRLLVALHRRASGGNPGIARLLQYREVSGPIQLLQLARAQFLKTQWSARLGLSRAAGTARDDGTHIGSLMRAGATRTHDYWTASRLSPQFWGLFEQAGAEAWWMGRQAQFIIDPTGGTVLRVQGIHAGEMHRLARGKPNLDVRITVDDEPRGVVALGEWGPFDVSVDLGPLPANRPAVLGLVPDASFVPRELGVNEDNRTLSVQIARIDLGDTVVFNAAHPRTRSGPTLIGPPGVNVIGYARSEHGVGQSTRAFVSALDAAGVTSSVIDFNEGNLSRTQDLSLEQRFVAEPVHGINVFHINADQMHVAELHLPSHVFERFNIGYWAWELPEMLDEHLSGFRRVNEVWVPSTFVQDAISKKSPVPVLRVPHAICFTASAETGRRLFALPAGRFLVLTMYDFSSIQERKNPAAALDAFDRAFERNSSEAALVIKTQNADFHPEDLAALRERLAGRNDVVWINETLSRQDVYDLLAACDAFISLHRSEGFGFALAEAMFLGKPVIATNWSGNTDFMRPDNSFPVNFELVRLQRDFSVYRAGQVWAAPDVEHAAWSLRQAVEDGPLRAKISRQAMRTIREDFSPETVGRRIRARLDYLQTVLQSR